jgi:uncharacterized membrane protein (UPF0136 family)
MTMTMQAIRYSILLLSSLILVGGVIGYTKAKSKASLIAGIVSAVLLDLCFALTSYDVRTGLVASLFVIACLDVIFVVRLVKTAKFMPSGMLLALCLAEQAILVYGLVQVGAQ